MIKVITQKALQWVICRIFEGSLACMQLASYPGYGCAGHFLPKEKLLYSINRRPKMFNQSGVKLLSRRFRSSCEVLGMKAFEWYVQKGVQDIF